MLVLDLPTTEGWKAELTQVTGYILRCFTRPQTVTYPITNPVDHSWESHTRPVAHKSDALPTTSSSQHVVMLICWLLQEVDVCCGCSAVNHSSCGSSDAAAQSEILRSTQQIYRGQTCRHNNMNNSGNLMTMFTILSWWQSRHLIYLVWSQSCVWFCSSMG